MSSQSHIVALAVVFATTGMGTITSAQSRPNSFSEQQVGDLLSHIDTRTKSFTVSLDRAIDRSQMNGSQVEAQINQSVADFKQATDRLRGWVNEGVATSTDVASVLRPGSSIDQFMTVHPLDASAQRDWQNLRRDLDKLAHTYGVTWYWSSSQYLRSRGDDQQVGRHI